MRPEKFTSFDNTVIQCYLWDSVSSPKGIVQISHGMAEHARRYDDFAKFLNKNGFIVFADDHRAHGMTSTKQSKKGVQGYHKGDIFNDTVSDELAISKYLVEKYNLPLIYFGHSYGTFIGQRYIQLNEVASGVILSGSTSLNVLLPKIGAGIAKVFNAIVGGETTGTFMDKLSFGSYNKPFKSENIPFAWLSRDHEQVKKYCLDEQCGMVMSVAFYNSFMQGAKQLYKSRELAKINKELPIAMFSGSKDPVSNQGKDFKVLAKMYKDLGANLVEAKLYEDARHEILNEINNAEVYQDILDTINNMI